MVFIEEIEPIISLGRNKNVKPSFVSPTIFSFASSNAITFVDCQKLDDQQKFTKESRWTFWAEKCIVAYDCCYKNLAYAERSGKEVHVIRMEIPVLDDETIGISKIFFSPNEEYLAVVTDVPNFIIHIYKTNTWELICQSEPDDSVFELIFNPENPRLFSVAYNDGSIYLFEIILGHTKHMLKKKELMYENQYNPNYYLPSLDDSHNDIQASAQCWLKENILAVMTKNSKLLFFHGDSALLSESIEISDFITKQVKQMVFTKGHIIISFKDGKICWYHWLELGQKVREISIETDEKENPFDTLIPSPDHMRFLFYSETGAVNYFNLKEEKYIEIYETESRDLIGLSFLPKNGNFLTMGNLGILKFWNSETQTVVESKNLEISSTVFETEQWLNIIAVGDTNGNVYLYTSDSDMKLIFKKQLSHISIKMLSFDPSHEWLAVKNVDGDIYMLNLNTFQFSEQLNLKNIFQIRWASSKSGKSKFIVSQVKSWETIFEVFEFNEEAKSFDAIAKYELNDRVMDFVVNDSFDVLLILNEEANQKLFKLKENNQLEFVKDLDQFNLINGYYVFDNNLDIVTIKDVDGNIHVSYISELNEGFKCIGKSPDSSMLQNFHISYNENGIFSLGNQGTKQFWRWKSGNNKPIKEAYQKLQENVTEKSKIVKENLFKRPAITQESLENNSQTLKESTFGSNHNEIFDKFSDIKTRLKAIIEKNAKATELEQLKPEDFVIDLEEKENYLKLIEEKTQSLKLELEQKNLECKNEFWDQMAIPGKSIHPFMKLDYAYKISNYPIPKRSEKYLSNLEKIKLQFKVKKSLHQNANHEIDSLLNNELKWLDWHRIFPAEYKDPIVDLLLHPFKISTQEHRRDHSVLIEELILTIKEKFNKNFDIVHKQKQNEISKIEERNARIQEIIQQLGIENEEIWKPHLEADENPEKVWEVRDEEIKAEKWISPEEQLKLEKKRKEEKERLESTEGDSRRRALMVMMGGKLEERAENEPNLLLEEPVCLIKPEESLTDEEKKQIKEYREKQAIVKDEQEKRRKALESEMKKLSQEIQDICLAFDRQLFLFWGKKVEVETLICRIHLQLSIYKQYILLAEEDDEKESCILKKIEYLKIEKDRFIMEIPAIKKDLDHFREIYDQALKKDKDIERQFKKEFSVYDFFFETLTNIFKEKPEDRVGQIKEMSSSELTESKSFNPFALPEEPPKICINVNLYHKPEGFPEDAWHRFLNLKKLKIQSEEEVQIAFTKFTHLQQLVSSVLENSERIRVETDALVEGMQTLQNYKQQSLYNPKFVWELKQSQVEVPQAYIATDYQDATLLKKQIIESLNQKVYEIGRSKVDALIEMKSFRKGIDLLEWENKIFDFKSEDLVIKARDIRLLRLTEEMQEYLRSGDKKTFVTEITALEKRQEYNMKNHGHVLELKKKSMKDLKSDIKHLKTDNERIIREIQTLKEQIKQKQPVVEKFQASKRGHETVLKELQVKRKLQEQLRNQEKMLIDLEKQAQDLRMRNYPNIPKAKTSY